MNINLAEYNQYISRCGLVFVVRALGFYQGKHYFHSPFCNVHYLAQDFSSMQVNPTHQVAEDILWNEEGTCLYLSPILLDNSSRIFENASFAPIIIDNQKAHSSFDLIGPAPEDIIIPKRISNPILSLEL